MPPRSPVDIPSVPLIQGAAREPQRCSCLDNLLTAACLPAAPGEFKWGNSRFLGITGYPKMDCCHKWMIPWDSPIYGTPPKYRLVKQLNQRMANLRWSKFGDGNLWQRLHGFTETVENPSVSPKASKTFFPLPEWIPNGMFPDVPQICPWPTSPRKSTITMEAQRPKNTITWISQGGCQG